MVFCILTREISKRTDPLKKKRSPEKNRALKKTLQYEKIALSNLPRGLRWKGRIWFLRFIPSNVSNLCLFRWWNTLDFFFLQNWSQRLIGGFGSIILPFPRGVFYLGFHVDFPGCSPKYLWKQLGLIRSCWSMRTVFWDWDRANLETFFVELPMTHTIHNIQLSWFQMVRFKLFWPPTKVYLFQPLTTLPQIFVGHAEMLLDGKITWNLLGGSPPSMFHRCSWGLPRQGSVVWRLVGHAPGIKFCPTCRRWHVPELKVSWSWNRWMDGCCVPIFGGSATGREFLATPDSATQWFPKMMIFF